MKIYLFLNVLQRSYYEYKSMFVYILKKYYILLLSNVMIGLLLFFKNQFIHIFVILSLITQLSFIFRKSKVFLKFTKRVIRLLFTIILEIVLLSIFVPYVIIDLLIPFVIMVADWINKPIELLINNLFVIKAKNKIKDINAVKIAITGSFGKTSVKNYINDTLKIKYIIKATPKSYNTPLGIAKFINGEDFTLSDFLVYEFGARRSGDIKELARNYAYDIAVITSIGKMHIDTFKNQRKIIEEKMSILNHLNKSGFAILNYENEYIRDFVSDVEKYTYGFTEGDFQARNIEISIFNSKFDLYINDVFTKNFCIKPLGKGAILNVLPAIILCYLYDVEYENIEKIESVKNRLSLRKLEDYYILDDAYNSNILGATYAFEVLSSHNGKRFIITPGFAEMNLIKEELAVEYGMSISDYTDCVILVKNDFTLMLNKYIHNKEVHFVDSFKTGFELFLKLKEKNSILLIENDLME